MKISNICLKVSWPIVTKLNVEPTGPEGTRNYLNCPGHMTNMAKMPLHGKTSKSSSPEPMD